MSNLYIITGPAGVGKSTISKRLAESKNKSVLIEGDDIYHQVVGGYTPAWKKGNHLDTFLKVCINSIKIYLEDGYDVVFNYVLDNEDVQKIKDSIKDVTIRFTVLLSDEKTIMLRDKEREEDCRMNERCLILLNSFKKEFEGGNNTLDTSNMSIDEVVTAIDNDDRFII